MVSCCFLEHREQQYHSLGEPVACLRQAASAYTPTSFLTRGSAAR